MNVREVREIREKKSLEWCALPPEQRNEKIKTGANEMQARIEEIKLKAKHCQ